MIPFSLQAPAAVEAQPLLAQVRRLNEALHSLGAPLSEPARRLLLQAQAARDDATVARLVQQALDPLCLATVEIRQGAPLRVTPAARPAHLVAQGWSVHLVKVLNGPGLTSTLRLKSENARPLPQSPPEEVAARWFDIEPFTQRPLEPTLSGLGLEYRVVQCYSRAPGRRTAALEFNVGQALPRPASARPLAKSWTFRDGAAGWLALSDCTLRAAGGVLQIATRDPDPYLAAPVSLPGGDLRLRMRLRIDHDELGQVFWATEEKPSFDGRRNAAFSLHGPSAPGRGFGPWEEVSVPFRSDGALAQLRLDLGQRAGRVEIDWIELAVADGPSASWTRQTVSFETVPARPVRLAVRDENGRPCTAAFTVRDAQGRVYPAPAKRLAPDFFFHSQIYRRDGETLWLPPGTYTVACRRGPESVPETKTLIVGNAPATLRYQVRRWIDPSTQGWWSGDHHIHAAGCAHYSNPTQGVRPQDMARQIQGEDLKVGCNLTWGPCFDFQKAFFTGQIDAASLYPYLLRYDIEVSGFGSHQSGHLCLLRLQDQMYPGGTSKEHWPTLCLNTLRWAKRQGALTGFAHSAIGLTGPPAGRVEGAADGPGGLPSYAIPPFDGIGAMEYVVDVAHTVPGPDGAPVPAVDYLSTMDTDPVAELNIWYHALNAGFRTRISGETDFPCISGERVGRGRSYVHLSGKLDFDAWCEGIRAGRCYVSDGATHLMDFAVDETRVGVGASELALPAPGTVRARVLAAVLRPDGAPVAVEAIVDGLPAARQELPGDGRTRALSFDLPVARSGWVALRVLGSAHTNPVWVRVGGAPLRPQRASVAWLLQSVDQLWSQKERFVAPAEREAARAAYEAARQTYRKLLEPAPAP